MGKIIITKKNNRLLLALFEQNRPELFSVAPVLEERGLLGNIYLARVKDVIPSIHGVFLSISAEQTVFLPMRECKKLLIANRELAWDNTAEQICLRQGDEVVVQISGEAVKTKQPSATCNLFLTGQYCVCDYFGHGLKYSNKLSEEIHNQLDEAIRAENINGRKQYGFVIRTNAGMLEDYEPLYAEMRNFIEIFNAIRDTYQCRTCYSCFYQKEPEILSTIKNIPFSAYDEIVTDEEAVYELLKDNSVQDEIKRPVSKVVEALTEPVYRYRDKPIRLYRDEQLSLSKLYSIETHLKEVLLKRVWLPCGGYLVIEPTEAMIVIDVNSGKTGVKDKKKDDYLLKVNLEAAKEIARQLRLRNYSGMIMVDFINMEADSDKQALMKYLNQCLKEDKVPTRLVDMTALGIVEITRKKINKPLFEFKELIHDLTVEN